MDNVLCPCCYRCAKQEGEECDAETEDFTTHRYCDSGLVCQKIGDVAHRAIGRCVGDRVQKCLNGEQHKKGCLSCSCSEGSETCEKEDVQCPPLLGCRARWYQPADKCCPVCNEVQINEPFPLPPEVILLGNVNVIKVKYGRMVSVVFHAFYLDSRNALQQLYILRNGVHIRDISSYISVEQIRVPEGKSFRDAAEITFRIKEMTTNDSGLYTLVAKNEAGELETNFTLKIRERKIRNCTFEEGLCDWETDSCSLSGSRITWMKKLGPAAVGGNTGPQTGFGGTGYYLYLDTSLPTFPGDQACLHSSFIRSSHPIKTLTFAYHMHGSDVCGLTVIQTVYESGKRIVNRLWTSGGNKGDKWHIANIKLLPTAIHQRSRVTFIATAGGPRGDIAIDSVSFY